jgi:hypothetical protein
MRSLYWDMHLLSWSGQPLENTTAPPVIFYFLFGLSFRPRVWKQSASPSIFWEISPGVLGWCDNTYVHCCQFFLHVSPIWRLFITARPSASYACSNCVLLAEEGRWRGRKDWSGVRRGFRGWSFGCLLSSCQGVGLCLVFWFVSEPSRLAGLSSRSWRAIGCICHTQKSRQAGTHMHTCTHTHMTWVTFYFSGWRLFCF